MHVNVVSVVKVNWHISKFDKRFSEVGGLTVMLGSPEASGYLKVIPDDELPCSAMN